MQLSLALLLCMCACGLAQDRVYSTQHKAKLNEGRKTIDAQFGGHGDSGPDSAQMAVLRDSVNLMLKNHEERLRAQATGNTAVAGQNGDQVQAQKTQDGHVQAQGTNGEKVLANRVGDSGVQATGTEGEKVAASSKGDRAMAVQGRQRANAALTREGEVVRGGQAQQGANTGKMNNQMINGQKVSQLEANRRFKADAAAISRNQFNAKTQDVQDDSARGQYAARSDSLSTDAGDGLLNAKNSEGQAQYKYGFNQDSAGQGEAQLDQVGAGTGVHDRRTTGWKCVAVKDGESTCLDANGNVVGKVMTNAAGDATVVDKNGVVVGRGKVNKLNEEQYEVIVSDGLISAKTEQLKEYDCYSEVVPGGAQEHKIAIENMQVMVDGEPVAADGSQSYSWPTCFDITGDVTVPEGVDPSRLAFEYVGHVMPMGSLKCMDSMTCGRDCYYCNACEKERLIGDDASITTGDSNAICDIHGGAGKQKVSMRVCPPAEVEKSAFCGGFDRHLVGNDYYKYDGSINAQVRVWLRPENEATLRSQFFNQIQVPLVKQGLVNQYKLVKLTVAAPTDNELLEWYVRKNGEEKLMACRRGVIDYSVGGSEVNSNFLIDSFANMPGQNVQLFSDAPCDEWKEQQKLEYNAYLKEHQESQATSGNSLSSLSRLLNFSRGRRL